MAKRTGWVWEFGGAVVPAALGLGANLFGAIEVSRGWLTLGLATLATVGAFVGRSVELWTTPTRSRNTLVGALATFMLFIGGIAVYHQWFDPARLTYRPFEFTVIGADETDCQGLHGEPGGPKLLLDPRLARPMAPVCPGSTTLIECRTVFEDNGWLRLAGSTFWMPEVQMRLRNGADNYGMPNC